MMIKQDTHDCGWNIEGYFRGKATLDSDYGWV